MGLRGEDLSNPGDSSSGGITGMKRGLAGGKMGLWDFQVERAGQGRQVDGGDARIEGVGRKFMTSGWGVLSPRHPCVIQAALSEGAGPEGCSRWPWALSGSSQARSTSAQGKGRGRKVARQHSLPRFSDRLSRTEGQDRENRKCVSIKSALFHKTNRGNVHNK